jgi:hypothetical protein
VRPQRSPSSEAWLRLARQAVRYVSHVASSSLGCGQGPGSSRCAGPTSFVDPRRPHHRVNARRSSMTATRGGRVGRVGAGSRLVTMREKEGRSSATTRSTFRSCECTSPRRCLGPRRSDRFTYVRLHQRVQRDRT